MTERRPTARASGLCGFALTALVLVAATPAGAQQATTSTVVYVPPDVGAPPTRTLAATRGLESGPLVQVLAPEQTGLTQAAQPTLFWYIDGPAAAPVELTLIDEQAVDPLLELDLGPAKTPGIHAVDLSAYDVHLEPGHLYQWSVAQVVDPTQRSADIVTSATLERRVPGAELAQALAGASPAARLEALARHGYWYDLQAELEAQISARPDSASLRALRGDLLAQIGLDDIAAEASAAAVLQ
jgi:Domain of Unknown Function (DUF928)